MITTPAPDMSTAQHRALTRAAADPAGLVTRGRGVSVTTLFGLEDPSRRWADVVWACHTRGGRTVNVVTGATITTAGRRALVLVEAQRAQQARDAEVRRCGIAARLADPFAVFNHAETVTPF